MSRKGRRQVRGRCGCGHDAQRLYCQAKTAPRRWWELGTWKESSHDQDLSGATQRNSMTTFYERERAHQDGLKHDGLAGRVTSMVQYSSVVRFPFIKR